VLQRSARTTVLIFGLLLSLACNLPAVFAPTPTPIPSSTPTPTIAPTPIPTPTPAPHDRIESAEQARFNGDWERALSEYQRALNLATAELDRGDAQFGIALTFVQSKQWEQGMQAARTFITDSAAHPDWGKGHFLEAVCLDALGRPDEAAQAYARYLEARPGRIDTMVLERRGDALRSAGLPGEAIPVYQAALEGLTTGGELRLGIKIGRAYMEAEDYEAAASQFKGVYASAKDGFTRATADYLMGEAYSAQGRYEEAYARYQDAVINYPQAYDSYLGLVTLVENGIPVDEFQRGLVDYYAEQYGVALAAFDRFLASNPEHDGKVHYYRGLTLRALGEYGAAVEDWDRLIEDFPAHELWDEAWEEKAYTQWGYIGDEPSAMDTLLAFVDAAPEHARAAEFLFDAGRSAERDGQLEKAAEFFERVALDYPDSALAYRATFLAGILQFRLMDLETAQRLFSEAMGFAQGQADRAALYLWLGKGYQAQGDAESARAAWNSAQEVDPNGYYGLRAADLVQGRERFDPIGPFDFNVDLEAERFEAEAWLRERFSIESPGDLTQLTDTLRQDPRMVQAEELWGLGRYGEAKAALESLRQSYLQDPEASYRLMHHMLDMGMYQPAIYNAKNILDLAGLADEEALYAPVYFNRVRFGPYFSDLIFPEAEANGFNAMFLLSVVRQESLFEGFATSYAAARGLMQIVPSTGQAVAKQVGWPPDFEDDDLYRPIVSVSLGAHYLREQRDRFGGDLYAALAAYNAGPGNAVAWKELAPDDPDLFLEVLRFSQPRDYIRVISWAFANYRRLYVADTS
jgi:soluble lytic murein transglycosylase